jgi:ankyrin repeat protein
MWILWNAIRSRNAAGVEYAIQNGASLRHDGSKDPLACACSLGHIRIVRILLDAGADARWNDPGGISAIAEACL